ncbi:MAG: hypothetical protein Q8P45_02975 [Candidatus Harrisonbacteria bacterium]|nr:hypothetical protein [Candidatus Harrisonbacteria bacterium]
MKKQFERLIQKDELHHAYIFHGDTERALDFARSLAGFLEMEDWSSQPKSDFTFINTAEEKGVEAARALSHFLSLAPLASKRRTALVFGAERLSVPAQNALLKIAEEAPRRALLILITADPRALLDTLNSRFQNIYFRPSKEISDEMRDRDMEKEALDFIRSGPRARSAQLKKLIIEERPINDFVFYLFKHLAKRPQDNALALKELSKRWEAMNMNVGLNKRLQLEAVGRFLD